MASSEMGHWQCDKSLPRCMEYMLDNKLLCDVIFLVGEERNEVHAHKFVLASRSPVFYAMLDGQLAEKGKIEIPDIDRETFLSLLRFMYTDNISLEAKSVLRVMYAAKKYCLDLLTKFCLEFLKESITPDNACTIMDAALSFSEENLFQKCVAVIRKQTMDCLKSEAFASISKDALISILKLDNMPVEEEHIYEQVMRWSKAECERQSVEVNFENKRLALGDALYELRFPVMDSDYFARHIGKTNLLTSDEKVEVFMSHTLKNEFSGVFKGNPRLLEKERVLRFACSSGSWNLQGKIDAIIFKTSHESFLHGITVYGCASASSYYTIDVVVRDSRGRELLTHSTRLQTDCNTVLNDVEFKDNITVRANEVYTVELKMVGSSSQKGTNGLLSVAYGNGKTITFSNSFLSSNGTSVVEGQIPGLLLS